MTLDSTDLLDEQLGALPLADQYEIAAAVAHGRAVALPRLAPLAVAYAIRWQASLGRRLYRSWWYLGGTIVFAAVVATASSWELGALVALALAVAPQLSRGSITRARTSERLNRELLRTSRAE
ncbi:hypothetical protein [Leucobacter luti]|uniref:Uncharacterized protein n=1 Tax=Leucobacter luti TaxID=340320 RepID=A0A4Q7TQ35_9MICO|nr:hypothetical protein [Leucobacter luti]MBL3700001.1 hypothetical protein [Leucobacter luti]RZT62683.1 hypothetical protein EV139_2383 [Leucobacter luti]